MTSGQMAKYKYKRRIIIFYVVSGVLFASWLGLSILFAVWFITNINLSDENLGKYLIIAGTPIVITVFAIVSFLLYKPSNPKGYAIKPQEAPLLFSFIKETSQQIGFGGNINEILLTPGMSVSVYYRPSFTNLIIDSTCSLYIGVGLCRFLSLAELQAVIGHELAHSTQPQTKYKAYLAHMTNLSMMLSKNRFVGAKMAIGGLFGIPARLICRMFRLLFEVILNFNSREYEKLTAQMEMEADQISATTFGADNMLSALNKSTSINARLVIYKTLILPYIASNGHNVDRFWKTFDDCNSFFERIDGMCITPANRLLRANRSYYGSTEQLLQARLAAIQAEVKPSSDVNSELAIDLIPAPVTTRMDRCLSKKYCPPRHSVLTQRRLTGLLDELYDNLFAEVTTIDEAFTVIDDVLRTALSDEKNVPQVILPKYVQPSCDLSPQNLGLTSTEFIYSTSDDKCPVCGHDIADDTKVCPHCHEIIAE